MNRGEYNEVLGKIIGRLEEKGGNFAAIYGSDPEMLKQAKMTAAVALMAVDEYYVYLSRIKAELKEEK